LSARLHYLYKYFILLLVYISCTICHQK